MRFGIFRKSLLILALALSQWLVLAHALQHPALAQDQSCQICQHAQGLDSAAVLPPAPALVLLNSLEILQTPPLPEAPSATVRRYPIRGPPSLVS